MIKKKKFKNTFISHQPILINVFFFFFLKKRAKKNFTEVEAMVEQVGCMEGGGYNGTTIPMMQGRL
jgi:hypothetical protein